MLKLLSLSLTLLSFISVPSDLSAMETKSFLPNKDLSRFVVDHFDLSTIRSSFGPRLIDGQPNYLRSFGLVPSEISERKVIFENDEWFYSITILGLQDYNKDGIEDVFICFTDDAKIGTYLTVQPYLLTRYNFDMSLIALSYTPYHKDCLPQGGEG